MIRHLPLYERERQRIKQLMQYNGTAVFVFGSNRKGVHGAGAAAHAARYYGAKRGLGEGPAGRSYAIPTKDTWQDVGLPLEEIRAHVERFLNYAGAHPLTVFVVTRIGCGYAGYTDAEIAPLFAGAPPNCKLPEGWRELAS